MLFSFIDHFRNIILNCLIHAFHFSIDAKLPRKKYGFHRQPNEYFPIEVYISAILFVPRQNPTKASATFEAGLSRKPVN